MHHAAFPSLPWTSLCEEMQDPADGASASAKTKGAIAGRAHVLGVNADAFSKTLVRTWLVLYEGYHETLVASLPRRLFSFAGARLT